MMHQEKIKEPTSVIPSRAMKWLGEENQGVRGLHGPNTWAPFPHDTLYRSTGITICAPHE
jgi:hypothetical protein